MTTHRVDLLGDGIENPFNARALQAAARMFGAACFFRDRHGLAAGWEGELPCLGLGEIAARYDPLVAFDNGEGAAPLYGFRLPRDARAAVAVGNEREGLAADLLASARHALQVPMASRTLNCLNVAAAAAVALYYLSHAHPGRLQTRGDPRKRRPELLLIGGADHIELGGTIRSAGAFGWERVFVEDRGGVWFGCDRVTRSEGRGAARRGRNPIRLVAVPPTQRYRVADVCVITTRRLGEPLPRARLAEGGDQLLVLPDESRVRVEEEDWQRLGAEVRFAHVEAEGPETAHPYRLPATIALAEAARQIGVRARPAGGRPRREGPEYEKALPAVANLAGEEVFLDDLVGY
jgi:hypothetical protein